MSSNAIKRSTARSTALMCRMLSSLVLIALSPFVADAQVVPGGGERLRGGDEVTIRWNAEMFDGNVAIDLWDGAESSWNSIAYGVEGRDGQFHWRVPAGIRGNLFRVRVSLILDPGVRQLSGTYFTILDLPGNDSIGGGAAFGSHRLDTRLTPAVGAEIASVAWEEGRPVRIELVGMDGKVVASHDASTLASGIAEFAVGLLPRGPYAIRALFDDGSVTVNKVILF